MSDKHRKYKRRGDSIRYDVSSEEHKRLQIMLISGETLDDVVEVQHRDLQ
jgi:hypothetical protein